MTRFCVGCGGLLEESWAHCPACGVARVGDIHPEARSPSSELRTEAGALIDAGLLREAEALVRERLALDRDAETILVLVNVLTRLHRYTETSDLLDEALALAPANPEAHMRRAEYLGRIGLYAQAIEELRLARHFLSPADVPALLHCQELDRWLRDRAKSSFVTNSGLPRLPGWLAGLRRRGSRPAEAS